MLEFLKWYFDNQAEIEAVESSNAAPAKIITELKERTWSMTHEQRWLIHNIFNEAQKCKRVI